MRVLLSAPRRTAAFPNYEGTLAVYGVSTYSFELHKKTTEIRVLDIDNGQSRLITNEEKTSAPNWVGFGNDILWLTSGDKGTEIKIGDADRFGHSYVAGLVKGSISDIKLRVLDENRVAVAIVSKAAPDGSIYNKEDDLKKRSSAMLYDSVMVRHWDTYVTPNKNAIFHGILQRGKPHITESRGRFQLGKLTNLLKDTRLESPIPPFGGADNFDLDSNGVGFVARDPDLPAAFNTKSNFYYVGIEDTATGIVYQDPVKIEVKGLEGASTSPALEPGGKKAAYLQMKQNGYESDRNRIVLVSDLTKADSAVEITESKNEEKVWDRSPGSITWGGDGSTLFLVAEDEGRGILFQFEIPGNSRDTVLPPKPDSHSGSVSDVRLLGTESSHLFLSSNSLIDNSVYSTLDVQATAEAKVINSNSRNGTLFGLSRDQISEIWFDGATNGQKVHAWVLRPSDFNREKTYPLAYLIHGGPQGSWEDSWSTRWNPAVFAEQGYVVVTPNPTGSTGYGQSFTDAIANEWGGLPYQDLVKGFEFIKANLTYVDTTRAVALGASYGGYMMAWLEGQDLGKEFKALVCHDGSLNIPGQLASDEQYFPNHDFGGSFVTGKGNMTEWEKWNPVKHVDKWKTPMLVIHNELDYRLPISEGLSMFNVLQERGIKSRFLTFPDENHWVLREENSLIWHTVVLNWINRFVGLPEYKDERELGLEVQN